MREAVIVSTARTGLAKSFRGGFNDTEAPAMGGHVVRAAVERAGIDPAEVDDCIFGAAAQQGTQSYHIGRLSGIAGGLPDSVAGMAIERQCSSGLMSIAAAAKSIMCNEYDIAVAGGVESISLVQPSTRMLIGMCHRQSTPWTLQRICLCWRPLKWCPNVITSVVKPRMSTLCKVSSVRLLRRTRVCLMMRLCQ